MRRVFTPLTRGAAHDMNPGLGARRGLALLLAAALLNLTGLTAGAYARTTPPAAGEIVAAQGINVDGSPATPGQTFFSGSDIVTEEGAASALRLANHARLELSGGTALKLDFTDSSVGGRLEAGGTRLFIPRGVTNSITTADASISSDAEAGQALFSVQILEEGTKLTVKEGRVLMSAGGRALVASAGETLWAARGSAPRTAPPQGNNLSSEEKAWLFGGIAAAVTAIIIIIAGRDDDEAPPIPCPVLDVSPNVPLPPGC